MKLGPLSLIFFAAFCLAVLAGNKNGRATQSNVGNTGAPGDATQGGSPETCINCHNNGPILASVNIQVLDSANQVVTQYRPGHQYIAQVKITASGTNLKAYGFQMIALRDSGNTDLKGFSDPSNSNNYKLKTITNGRTYAEHPTPSLTDTFNVRWQAPVAGTGRITFYAAGNGVNNTGTSANDGSGKATLKLTEQTLVTTQESTEESSLQISVDPNPIFSSAFLQTELFKSGAYTLGLYDGRGQLLWESRQLLPAGINRIALPLANQTRGGYFVQLRGEGQQATVKVMKL